MWTRTFWLMMLIFGLVAIGCGFSACSGDDDDDDDDDDDFENLDDDSSGDDDSGDDDDYVVAPVENPAPPWPEWALRHWVWEDESTQESALALVDGYLDNDIPVGAIIIDSPWETGYNTFLFDTDNYPDAQQMIDDFHASGVRVFLWITPNVNVDSPNFQEGLDNGYYVNNGWTAEWWKGDGAFIDFLNPEALDWWHAQMDLALDLNIDGWKCDGSEFYLYLRGVVQTMGGTITVSEYQALYYSDFFNYTRARLGEDRIITARPVDSYGIPIWGPSFAPRDVNFAGWVGDQDPTWGGLNAALINLFFSAQRGYVNFGSDIGGYRGDDPRDKELFLRWAQLGALCPIMENGGSGEHRPWMYDQETLEIYRDFVDLHHALIPYLYSQGADSYAQGISLMRPYEKGWNYQLGDELFVSAIATPGTQRSVPLPAGQWIDYWDHTQYEGGTTHSINYPLERYPVFVRKGAILPQDLGEDSVFESIEGELPPITVSLYPDPGTGRRFDVFEEKGTGAHIEAQYGAITQVRLSATVRPYAFRMLTSKPVWRVDSDPAGELGMAADMESLRQAQTGWLYLPESGELWVKPGDCSRGQVLTIQ